MVPSAVVAGGGAKRWCQAMEGAGDRLPPASPSIGGRVRETTGDQPGTYRYYITHVFTPETNGSIHYWWFNSRDFKPGDKAIDDYLHGASAKAYYEDVEALEWIMEVVEKDQEQQFDMSFAPDRPGLMARRIMYRKAMAEQVGDAGA